MWRSLFFVPALNERFVARDAQRCADPIVLREWPDPVPHRFAPLRGWRVDFVREANLCELHRDRPSSHGAQGAF